MSVNKFCTACNLKTDSKNYLKDTTVCKSCYNKNRRKNNKNISSENELSASHQQPEIDNVINNNTTRTFLVRPSFSGKSYLMKKFLSRMPSRDINITNNRFPNSIPIQKSKSKRLVRK